MRYPDSTNTPPVSVNTKRYVFSILTWQGIARMHHNKITNVWIPQATPQVGIRIQKYLEKQHALLCNTAGIPVFLPTNQFLSYRLCPPMVQTWHKNLELGPLITTLPNFPWFSLYEPVPIDPAKEYADVALPQASAPPHATTGTNITPTLTGLNTNPAAQGTATTSHLTAAFQFFGSLSKEGTPSSKIQTPSPFQTLVAITSLPGTTMLGTQHALFTPPAPPADTLKAAPTTLLGTGTILT